MQVPFFDLKLQNQFIRSEIDLVITSVIDEGIYVGGNAVTHFEHQWASTLGAKHCIGVANCTDGLEILLKAFGIGAGDEVIIPSHTWVSTAEAVISVGATPVFVDTIDLFYTLDPQKIESRITQRTKAIIPVHLAGLAVDMDAIMALSVRYKLWVIEDCAQSHLSKYKGKFTGTLGHAAAFSFYPTKNLGAFGDAGAIVTNDDAIATLCRVLADHGQEKRNLHVKTGRNSRLDTLQASLLSLKLKYLKYWNELRNQHALHYQSLLNKRFAFTPVPVDYNHNYHLFIIQINNRDQLKDHLKLKGIDCRIHYPMLVHKTKAFKEFDILENTCMVSERYTAHILSLPIYPELTEDQVNYTCDIINSFRG